MDIVTIHPGFVLGPVLSRRTDATSVSRFRVGAPCGCDACLAPPSISAQAMPFCWLGWSGSTM